MNTRIALLGQPNSGKSTVYNALTGSRQHVGNWPGKTVEKNDGYYTYKGTHYTVTDLPGSYGLCRRQQPAGSYLLLQERHAGQRRSGSLYGPDDFQAGGAGLSLRLHLQRALRDGAEHHLSGIPLPQVDGTRSLVLYRRGADTRLHRVSYLGADLVTNGKGKTVKP